MDRRAVSRLSRGTDEAVRLAQRDLSRFWRGLDVSNPAECRQALLDFLPDLVATYGNVAAVAAVEWWEEQRAKTPGLPAYSPTISDGVPASQVQASTRAIVGPLWLGEPEKVLGALASATQMWVKYASRDTIARNVAFDPAEPRYARVPRGAKTCAFCAMLASRGWVYLSEKLAGIKGSGNEFHHDCDCEIVPSWDRKKAHIDGYDPDAMYDRYQQAREAVMNRGEDPNDSHTLLAVMRRLHPDAYKDGIGDQGRSPGTGRGMSKIPRRLQLGKVRSGKGGGDGTVDLTKYDTHRNEIIARYNADPDLRASGAKVPPRNPYQRPRNWPNDLPALDAKSLNHALYSERVGPEIKGGHLHGYGWIASRPTLPEGWTEEDVVKAAEHVLRTAWSDGVFGDVTATFRGVSVIVHVKRRKSGYRVASIFPEA